MSLAFLNVNESHLFLMWIFWVCLVLFVCLLFCFVFWQNFQSTGNFAASISESSGKIKPELPVYLWEQIRLRKKRLADI
jgi:hypothetical protein